MKGLAPGILFIYLLDAVLLTAPVSLVLIWLYRRAVAKGMHAVSPGGAPSSDVRWPAAERRQRTGIGKTERGARLRLSVLYTLAGAAAAIFWTALYFSVPDLEFTPLRGFVVFYALCWPIPGTLIILLALPWRRTLRMMLGYLFAGAAITLLWSLISRQLLHKPDIHPLEHVWSFVTFLFLQAGLPIVILAIAANRRIRGVSPLALSALLVFTFSSLGALQAFTALLEAGRLQGALLRIGPGWWFMAAAVPVGYLCWRLLAFLNARYEHKSFSDVQLLVDSCWIIAAFSISAEFATTFGWKGVFGLGGFVVYRLAAEAGMAVWRRPDNPGVRLLVLRVFGFRSRTEKLFDAIAQQWRFRGEVAMIAGTDLAARTMDPDDTLAFLGGDLRSLFIAGADDLQHRLTLLDEIRDPDGRFRVTEFFCHQNTWEDTLAAVLAQSDAVLMDLRGFSEKNCGCLFELRQLAVQEQLRQTVFITDRSTDIGLLESTIGRALGQAALPPLRLENVERDVSAERERLYHALRAVPARIV
jgi:hypothetical protein